MAQFFTDFRDDTIGQVPSGWQRTFALSGSFSVQSVGGAYNVLRFTGSYLAGDRRGIAWTDVGVVSGEVELYARFRMNSTNANVNAAMLFLGGGGGTEEGIVVQFGYDPGVGNRYLATYVDGAGTANDTDAGEFATTGFWNVILYRVANANVYAKYWMDGDPEPAGWDLLGGVVTDPTSGYVGLTVNSMGSAGHTVEWAGFGVGTGGDPAPREFPVTEVEPVGDADIDATGNLVAVESAAPYYSVAFPPSDAISTDPGELTWSIHTAAGAGGTELAAGTATTGDSTTAYIYDDPTLGNGVNTRYIYLVDGAGNYLDQPFTVNALFEVEVPMAGDADVDADGALIVEAELAASGDAAVDAEGDAAIEATVPLAGDAESDTKGAFHIVLDLTGGAAVDAEGELSITPVYTKILDGDAAVDAEGTLAVFYVTAFGGTVEVDTDGTFIVTADVPLAGDAEVEAEGDVAIRPVIDAGDAEVDAAGEAVIAPAISGDADLDTEGDVHVDASVPVAGDVEVDVEAQVVIDADVPMSGAAEVDAEGRASVELIDFEIRGHRIRVDFQTPGGEPVGAGPVTDILSAGYGMELDNVGTFDLSLPATHPVAGEITAGTEAHIFREGEGEVFRGIVHTPKVVVPESGEHMLQVAGDSVARELVWANTLFGREFSNEVIGDAIDTLISGTDWTAATDADGSRNLTAQYEAASVWRAVTHSAKVFGWHVRENNLTRSIEVGEFGDDSGLVFRNVSHIEPGMGVIPIQSLELTSEHADLWNSVIPVGAGDGINVLTLRHSDRSGPYAIQNATGPDGETYFYIEDAASIIEHGRRVMPLSFDDVVPLSNSDAEIRNAANALYDLASAWLGWHATPYQVYDVTIAGLTHYADGTPRFRVGDTARLIYRGVATDTDGETIVWKDIDAEVYILGFQRAFTPNDLNGWTLTLGTTDRQAPTDADTIAQAIDELWAAQTSKRPYTYREVHGPYVQSIDPETDATFLVDFDENVTYLRQAILRVRPRAVKSNVAGAAAGGGQTSEGSGDHTHSIDSQVANSGGGQTSESGTPHSHSVSGQAALSGGGQTSEGGTPHAHTVPAQTIFSSGDHFHQWATAQPTQSWNEPVVYKQQIVTENAGGFPFGFYTRRDGSTASTDALYTISNGAHIHNLDQETTIDESSHTHDVQDHQHLVSATAAVAESSHTHDVQDHQHPISATTTEGGGDHTHEIVDHIHALEYGIFEGPHPNAPFLRVTVNGTDRTAALGGPWNGAFTADITPWLVDGTGQILRGANDIDISGSQLCDVEVTVKSLVTATSVVPV